MFGNNGSRTSLCTVNLPSNIQSMPTARYPMSVGTDICLKFATRADAVAPVLLPSHSSILSNPGLEVLRN